MLGAAFTVWIFFYLPRSFHAAEPQLAAPRNVTMVTLNTNYTLRWDWDQSWAREATFTTAYIGEFRVVRAKQPDQVQWNVLCANQSRRSCDLSGASLFYLGKYLVRVRAEAGGRRSPWVKLSFHPDREAMLGPPSRVALSRDGSSVDVHIDDPVTTGNASMRTVLPHLYYHILYWEGPCLAQPSQVHNVTSKANLVTLPGLQDGTWYSVVVQSRSRMVLKESSFTSPLCIRTEGVAAWWIVVLCFLGSMVLLSLLVLFFYKACPFLKDVFFPPIQLPAHLREYLQDSPGSDTPRLLGSEEEQLCDKVLVCPRMFPEELQPPVEAAPPSCLEEECSHQGGSRDSGVYSSDSGSSVSQQTSSGSDVFWTDLCHLDKLKVEARAAGLLGVDEGISEVCG